MFLADAYNIDECVNSVCGKFIGNGDRKKISWLVKIQNIFVICVNFFRELLIYKLLTESSFNLFCPLLSFARVLASKSLKIVTTKVVRWLILYVILYEVNVFVLAYSCLFICYLTKLYIMVHITKLTTFPNYEILE